MGRYTPVFGHNSLRTESGRVRNKDLLRDERDSTGKTDWLRRMYQDFPPLNARLLLACTHWQLRATQTDRLAANGHSDKAWDTEVLDELKSIDSALSPLADQLGSVLARFVGYGTRFAAALVRARAGEHEWVDRTDVDSCHRVWFELHEDLIATLGIDRRAESTYGP